MLNGGGGGWEGEGGVIKDNAYFPVLLPTFRRKNNLISHKHISGLIFGLFHFKHIYIDIET